MSEPEVTTIVPQSSSSGVCEGVDQDHPAAALSSSSSSSAAAASAGVAAVTLSRRTVFVCDLFDAADNSDGSVQSAVAAVSVHESPRERHLPTDLSGGHAVLWMNLVYKGYDAQYVVVLTSLYLACFVCVPALLKYSLFQTV